MASGWAVIDRNGNVDMRTVSDTRRAATVNWLCARCGMLATVFTSDDEIEREWQVRSRECGAGVRQVSVIPCQ
jgi:hypothetical protein